MEAPKYLLQKKLLQKSVLFIVGFSILFMIIYQPFSATAWFGFYPLSKFLTTVLFYIISVAILIVSKKVLFIYQSKHDLSITIYSLWISSEFILIGVLYLLFTEVIDKNEQAFSIGTILRTSLCVGLILSIPYIIITLYAGYRAKAEELSILLLQRKMRNLPHEPHLINLYDYNDSMKISIYDDAILYIESQDNYVQIYYEMDEKMRSYLLRVRTQKLEEQLTNTTLIRCHRSFIININKIKLYKNEHNRATAVLTNPNAKNIPISKSYYKAVTEIISSKGCPQE
jgi:hypothetical protein